MPLLNKSLKSRRPDLVGDKVYGAPGGYRDADSFVCSYDVADALAAEAGLSAEHAHRYLIALGKVMQRFLLRGEPVGIPHLGVLYLDQRMYAIHMGGLIKQAKKAGAAIKVSDMEGRRVIRRYVVFSMPERLRKVFRDSAVHTGDVKTHVKRKREKLRRRLRHHKRDKNDALKHTKEGPIMEPATPAKPAKPVRKLMVEDADAVVETNDHGRQEVRKVPDRKAEAERQGVAESQL